MNKRLDALEKEFSKRYNRKTEITQLPVTTLHSTKLEIISPKKTKFIITEYRKGGLTEYVTLEVGDKNYRYKRYVDAEVHIADLVGEEEEKG